MTGSEDLDRQLHELVAQGLQPPVQGEPGRLKRWLREAEIRLGRPHARHQQMINSAMLAELERLAQTDAAAARTREHLTQAQEDLAERRAVLVRGLDELREWLSNLQREHSELQQQLAALRELVPGALPLYGEKTIPLETFDAGLGGSVVGFREGTREDVLDRVYVGFEDYFRGTEETIKGRQRAYVPLLKDSGPVLDVGCGRGELLELLADLGVDARGVDIDQAMVDLCRGKGLAVDNGDAVSALEELNDDGLGAVVALQVIEHLPYPELLAFLRTSRRKLRPGGRLIMETVNPHSPQALKHFWMDPTHQHPLFPEIVVALCALTGFASSYIWYPQGSGEPNRDRGLQADYAVVAQTSADWQRVR